MKKSIKYEGYILTAIILVILIIILLICYEIGETERVKQADKYRTNKSTKITRYTYEVYNIILASVGKNDSYIYIKVLDEEEDSVKNAILKLYNEEGIILAEKETTVSGITGFSGMESGIYYILETEVQSGYNLDETLYKIEITDDHRYFEFEIENARNDDYEEKTENNYFDTCDFRDIANKRDENLVSSESIDINSKQIIPISTEIESEETTEIDENNYFYRIGIEKLKDERVYLQTLETIKKIEDDETYYYTAFKLKLDNYEIVEYEVSKLFYISDGVSIVDEDGNKIDTLSSDDVFYLKYTETSKSTGYIEIEFTLKYDDNTKYSFTLIHKYELPENESESQSEFIVDEQEDDEEVGKILLVSKDQNGDPVSNNKFTLTRTDGTYIGEVTSGVTGMVTFYSVPVGEYVIELISESSKYYSEVTSKTITIDNGWTTYVGFTSEKLSGFLQITVTDDLNRAIEGAEYTLYDAEGYVLETAVSDVNGKIKFENIDGGRYYYKCTSYDGQCIIDDTLYTSVIDKDNQTFYKTCTFERWKGYLLLVVTDENDEPANDISYTVYDENKEKEITTITTNEKGLAGVRYLPVGTYYYKQDDSSDEYHEFTLEEDEQIAREDITVLK